jgi:hypothetical protein
MLLISDVNALPVFATVSDVKSYVVKPQAGVNENPCNKALVVPAGI